MIRIRVDYEPKPANGLKLEISPAAWAALRAALIDGLTKTATGALR